MEPLNGVQVVDVTHTISGPVCSQMLQSLGAEVVKVEPPRGESGRTFIDGSIFASYNGGKRSLAVDLTTDAGTDVAHRLVAESDVLVENFVPGTIERLGLDYDSCRAINEEIVYCSISGFGQDGPYTDYPAYDPVIQAMSGIMELTGESDGRPVRLGASGIDHNTGVNAAFAILAALMDRNRTGSGRHLDVSLFDTGVSWMAYWIAEYTATGEEPSRTGAGMEGVAPSDIFRVGEDDLLFLTAPNDRLFEKLCAAIDREELCTDERFATREARWEHRAELTRLLEARFATYSLEGLHDRLVERGIPSAPIRNVDAVVEGDEHVEQREMLVDSYNHHRDTAIQTSAAPFRVDGEAPPDPSLPPALGADSRAVLADLGYESGRIEELVREDVVVASDGA